jgi:hypothetical protein
MSRTILLVLQRNGRCTELAKCHWGLGVTLIRCRAGVHVQDEGINCLLFFFAENNGMVDAMQWGGIRNLRSGIPSICHLK